MHVIKLELNNHFTIYIWNSTGIPFVYDRKTSNLNANIIRQEQFNHGLLIPHDKTIMVIDRYVV